MVLMTMLISNISNLKITMIKLTKTGDDSDYCNIILEEQIHLFNDDIYEKAIKLKEDASELNIVVEEEEEDKENNNIDDEKPTNNKELIQNTINKHNDSNTKKKEIKTDDAKISITYNNKNHLRRGGLDTDDEISHRKELTKIEEYDKTISKSNRRHEDVRLEHNFFKTFKTNNLK